MHESTCFESLVATFIASRKNRRRKKPRKLAADKAYSTGCIRDWIKQQRIGPVIPHKDSETARWDPAVKFDEKTYRQRAVIEQCVGWLKESRALATRFDKLAVNYLATVKLAMIQRYLRLLTRE